MNYEHSYDKRSENGFPPAALAKVDQKKELESLFAILSRSDPQELTKYLSAKSDSFPKFELNEESLLKLRQLSKFCSVLKNPGKF